MNIYADALYYHTLKYLDLGSKISKGSTEYQRRSTCSVDSGFGTAEHAHLLCYFVCISFIHFMIVFLFFGFILCVVIVLEKCVTV